MRPWRAIVHVALLSLILTQPTYATDLVVSGIEGVDVWLQDSEGKFAKTSQALSDHLYNAGGALGDLNGDGHLDWFGVALGENRHHVWFGKGNGELVESEQRFGGERSSWGMALVDFDGDADLDAFVSSSFRRGTCQPSELWRNDGKGRFELAQLVGEDCSTTAALSDLDGDRDVDVVTATSSFADGFAHGPGANKVWLNDGTGHLADSGQLLSVGTASYGVATGDVDRDGDADIVFGNDGANTVWRNDGHGRFVDSEQRLGTGRLSFAVALADLDGDGDRDAFFADRHSRVWLNDGWGHFRDSGQALGNGAALDVIVLDVDRDGDTDAIVANRNLATHDDAGAVQIWLNDGAARFTLSPQVIGSGRYRKVVAGKLH